MEQITDKFRVYFMQITVEQALEDAKAPYRFFEYTETGLQLHQTKNITFRYRDRVIAFISLTQPELYTDVVANWLDNKAIRLAKDWYEILHERLDVDIPEWIQSLPVDQTPSAEPPVTSEPEDVPSRVSPRRAKNKPMRIMVGLVRWRSDQTGDAIDTVCDETKLLSNSTFHNYQREGLAYTDDDIRQLEITWVELWSAFTRGVLDEYIKDILE